ncbi:MAG: 2-amino-4-hydroxy-6-hydroxymethyldihydropteridine diphosphokinase [Alphaproteobacteria bacterium]|nr:2-amino-4-hydroxy-6-hydroxymethyldihydropteridine diphosphokinase [Alphaproteobacteria bacterium]
MSAIPSRLQGGIYVALGANLASAVGPPRRTLEEALARIRRADVEVLDVSPWYETRPMDDRDQPRYVNGIAEVATERDPEALLELLHDIEEGLGRQRRLRWESRTVDLDLIDYRGLESTGPSPVLPHPGVAERLFVLLPLKDVAPAWRHPATGQPIDCLIQALPRRDGDIERLAP